MANSHIKEAQRQKKGDRRISASNFGVMVDKVNANGKIPFAKEDIESVRQVGSHTEIVLRRKSAPVFFANADQQGIVSNYNIRWGGDDQYIKDAPYKHDVLSDEHLITFLAAGRYKVDVTIQATLSVTSSLAADIEESLTFTMTTGGAASTSMSQSMRFNHPGNHALAHTHGGAVASDLSTVYHDDGLITLTDHISMALIIDVLDDLTDGELYVRVAFSKNTHTVNINNESWIRIEAV